MPSGAKKRKAARRKKEMGQGPPHSPTSPPAPPSPSGGRDGHGHGHHHDQDSASSGEEDAADRETAVGKREEAAVPVSKEVQQVSVEVVKEEVAPVPASEEAQEVGVESVPDGAPEEGVVADLPAVVHADGPSFAKEEVVEVAEPAAETSKTSIDVDSLSHVTEQKPVPVLNNLVSQVPRESTELCRGTADSEVSVTLLERRTTWWNCCGLFDVLTGSRGNSRT